MCNLFSLSYEVPIIIIIIIIIIVVVVVNFDFPPK